jgi:hypothetical protein
MMKLSTAVGRPLGASIVVVGCVVSDSGSALAGCVVEQEPGRAIQGRGFRDVGRHRRVLERETIVSSRGATMGFTAGQIRLKDLVAPFDHDVGDRLFGGRVVNSPV